MSQLARMVVALGMSQGIMSSAVAMDPDKIDLISCCRVRKFGSAEGFMALEESSYDNLCPTIAPSRYLGYNLHEK